MKKKIKQISFLSAIIIAVGTTIGAGIFFKNGTVFANAGGHLSFMIASWVIAAIGVLAIGLALVEMSSASKSDAGILEWVRIFAHKHLRRYSAAYMIIVYLPLNYFALPIYTVMSMQDAGGFELSAVEIIAIGAGILLWLITMGYMKLKVAERVQWLFTAIKFLPIIILPFVGFAQAGVDGVHTSINSSATGLTGLSPWLGLMASIPAILFAFDGFYMVTSLKSKLRKPKRLGSVVALSLLVVSIVYLLYSIGIGTAGATSPSELTWIADHEWIKITINVIIAIAVMGIINGFAMSVPNLYLSVFEEEPIGVIEFFMKLFRHKDKKFGAFMTSNYLTIVWIVLLFPLAYAFDTDSYTTYGTSANSLYSITDLVTNFTSLYVFLFIGFAIIGAIRNRKHGKINVEKRKYFLPAAWISVVFLGIGIAYMFIESIVNISGINGSKWEEGLIKFLIFLFTTIISAVPVIRMDIADRKKNRKSRIA